MDRAILLVLLGIPLLIIMHVALFGQQLPSGSAMISASAQDSDRDRAPLQGHWIAPEQPVLSRFVIRHISEQGS